MPSDDLVLVRSDGQLGPQLKRSPLDCDSPRKRDEAPPSSSEPVAPLKLVPSKAQVQVLVIDHIDRPTEN